MGHILVAGGSGFIGRALVQRLVREGSEVVVMSAHPERSSPSIHGLGAGVVTGDVQRPSTLPAAMQGADVVVQALTFPSFPVEKPSKGWTFTEFEHHGTERLARAAEGAGVKRFVYVSGVGVAPDAEKVWHRAKWFGEQALLATDLEAVIVRPSWVYGPRDRALNRFVAFARSSPMVEGIVISPGVAWCQSGAALARIFLTRSSLSRTARFSGSTCAAKARLFSVYSCPQYTRMESGSAPSW